MLAVDPVGLVVTALITAALVPGRFRLLRAAGAVLLGEVCRVVAAAALSATVVQMTMGGALSRYVIQEANPLAVGLAAAGLTALVGLLLRRSFGVACAVYAMISAAGTLWYR